MEKVKYLYGASGHCKVVIDILRSNNDDVRCIFDDYPKTEEILGIPVLKASLLRSSLSDFIIVSIGDNFLRKKVVSKVAASFFKAIHSTAILSINSKIGKGSVIMAGVIINSSVEIGEHCIINSGAVIEHDCKIGDFCHISPNASLAGNVNLGEGTHVGIGACVIQGVKIGKWVTIGAGSVIIKDVPDFATVVGNPGKIIKYKEVNE
ncbi:acetyltransferase [Flavobacterium hydatis]|uniref:Acetyltransferase n=1 Tax=Flavobacterium hydatis TaxID=991 RepID=A0A086ANK7_FLAHY|nr:acetyltransferase [Flavobacterium hydatis]KFF18271.1 acetyltransferase [Flavobacterium hydatis]OXA96979.1 acetyltransferase [Flavobacterium hydatis]